MYRLSVPKPLLKNIIKTLMGEQRRNIRLSHLLLKPGNTGQFCLSPPLSIGRFLSVLTVSHESITCLDHRQLSADSVEKVEFSNGLNSGTTTTGEPTH
ncbi:hypothetical protein, partial [Pseudomonas sp. 65/3-MNA-CIBAN-0223]|uniref:hypothetical protein n=1 Tax=Pseudomonas sp. 65/3-MNA-CIBAN-0223 TaxID=3140476 RepID=UPI00332F2F30